MGNRLPSINLVKRDNANVFDTFITWTLTVGRIVVILTEIVALGAFLYRFSLDQQLVDLHDKIKTNIKFVEAQKQSEQQYRELHNRLLVIEELHPQSTTLPKILADLDAILPRDTNFVLNNISISGSTIKIDANAKTITSISDVIAQLKKTPTIASISLDKIENRISSATIIANISIQLKSAMTNQATIIIQP